MNAICRNDTVAFGDLFVESSLSRCYPFKITDSQSFCLGGSIMALWSEVNGSSSSVGCWFNNRLRCRCKRVCGLLGRWEVGNRQSCRQGRFSLFEKLISVVWSWVDDGIVAVAGMQTKLAKARDGPRLVWQHLETGSITSNYSRTTSVTTTSNALATLYEPGKSFFKWMWFELQFLFPRLSALGF